MVSSAGVVKSQHGNAKPRRRDASNGQTAKKREMDRIAQKKSRERSKHRMQELEDKLNRLQDDDKQKQISELMDTIDELRRENERLRTMTERIRGLAEAAGPPLPRSGIQSASDTHGKQSPSPVSNSSEDYRMAASQQGHNYIQEMWQNPELTTSQQERCFKWKIRYQDHFPEVACTTDLNPLPLADGNPTSDLAP